MAAIPFIPYWTTHPFITPRGPLNWVFYIVAKIDDQQHHRTLAAVCQTSSDFLNEGIRGLDLLDRCCRLVTIFSDPNNRVAIEAEVSLAHDFYSEANRADTRLPLTELPEKYQYMHFTSHTPPGNGLHEFPFISNCLLLGSSYTTSSRNLFKHVGIPMPLDTVYRDDHTEYGMVAVDITHLDNIRYGIVGFTVNTMAEVLYPGYERNSQFGECNNTEVAEKDRPRHPLSAVQYMDKFGYEDPENKAGEFDGVALVDTAAMDLIWPSLDGKNPNMELDRTLPRPGSRSLKNQTITALVKSTFVTDSVEMSVFDEVRALPDFRELLQRSLQDFHGVGQSKTAGQLLSLAFEGTKHLDLVRIKGISAEAITVALETKELDKVESIRLCLDTITGSTPAQVVAALSQFTTLRDIYLAQSPKRDSDQLSTEYFLELCQRPQLFHQGRVLISGAYSAALRKALWLPTADDFHPPFDIFPMQHMVDRGYHDTLPESYYLGDALLGPEAFAAAFLHWMRVRGSLLHALAGGPPTLDDMSSSEVRPIPAENFVVPRRIWPEDDGQRKRHQVILGPKTRDLLPGGWTLLISLDKYSDKTAEAEHLRRVGFRTSIKANFYRYAFVRPRVRISSRDSRAWPLYKLAEHLEVVGMEDFLKATAPHVDLALVSRRLSEVSKYLAGESQQAKLPPGMKWLSVFEHGEACLMVRQFLDCAILVRENLKRAMRDKPQEHNWYPELMDESDV